MAKNPVPGWMWELSLVTFGVLYVVVSWIAERDDGGRAATVFSAAAIISVIRSIERERRAREWRF